MQRDGATSMLNLLNNLLSAAAVRSRSEANVHDERSEIKFDRDKNPPSTCSGVSAAHDAHSRHTNYSHTQTRKWRNLLSFANRRQRTRCALFFFVTSYHISRLSDEFYN